MWRSNVKINLKVPGYEATNWTGLMRLQEIFSEDRNESWICLT
jgi:hypothetical protein